MNDDDFLKIVNENYERAKKERERLAEEEYIKACKRNLQTYERECNLQKKKTIKTFFKRVAAVLLVIGTIRGGVYLHSQLNSTPKKENIEPISQTQIIDTDNTIKDSIDFGFFEFQNNAIYNTELTKLSDEINYIVSNNTHRTQNNDGYFYSTDAIARDILVYDGDYDPEAVLFGVYKRINYDVVNKMDEIFRCLNIYIEAQPDKYSKEVKLACNYSSFTDYLTAHGFNSIDDYKAAMQEIVYAYSDEAKVDLSTLLNNLYPEEGLGR